MKTLSHFLVIAAVVENLQFVLVVTSELNYVVDGLRKGCRKKH